MMRYLEISLLLLFLSGPGFNLKAQKTKLPYTIEGFISVRDTSFFQVVDGILMDPLEPFPANIKINSILKIGDTVRLKKMGLINLTKPYLFYNTSTTAFHKFIYVQAKIPSDLYEVNLPLIINNHLVTYSEYLLLSKIKEKKISAIQLILPPARDGFNKFPLGAIDIKVKGPTVFD